VLAAALVVFYVLAGRRGRPTAKAAGQRNYGLVLAVFAVFGLYVAFLPYLGFRIATLAFVAGLQSTLEPPRGWKGWLVVAVTALATTAIAYLLFERYLLVLLPRGRWTDF
jgi:hypothetical protein